METEDVVELTESKSAPLTRIARISFVGCFAATYVVSCMPG